jgi:hypothetical protein
MVGPHVGYAVICHLLDIAVLAAVENSISEGWDSLFL